MIYSVKANYRCRNNRDMGARFHNNYGRFSDKGHYNQRDSPNVIHYLCLICSFPGHWVPHCHVAMYHIQDFQDYLVFIYHSKCWHNTWSAKTTTNNWTKQWQEAKFQTFLELEHYSPDVASEGDKGLSGVPKHNMVICICINVKLNNKFRGQSTLLTAPILTISPRKTAKWKLELWHKHDKQGTQSCSHI